MGIIISFLLTSIFLFFYDRKIKNKELVESELQRADLKRFNDDMFNHQRELEDMSAVRNYKQAIRECAKEIYFHWLFSPYDLFIPICQPMLLIVSSNHEEVFGKLTFRELVNIEFEKMKLETDKEEIDRCHLYALMQKQMEHPGLSEMYQEMYNKGHQ